MDRLSGLLYANGRYYDPATGRYLTPDHSFDPLRPGTHNPYAPIQHPGMWLLLPLVGIVFAWRGRKRGGPWRMLVLVCVVGVGVTLVSCGPTPPEPGPTPIPTPPASPTPQTTTPEPTDQTPTESPPPTSSAQTPPLPPSPCPTPSAPESTSEPDGTPTPTIFASDEDSIQTPGGIGNGRVRLESNNGSNRIYAESFSDEQFSRITVNVRLWGPCGSLSTDNCIWDNKGEASGEGFNTNRAEAILPTSIPGIITVQHAFYPYPEDGGGVYHVYTSIGDVDYDSFECWENGPEC